MSDILPFYYHEQEIRVIKDEQDNPWWVAKDVCDILEYANPSKTITDHLDCDERSNLSLDRGGSLLIINESGLYTLIFRSNKPQAKKFRRWVTHEVLPAIRKTGAYMTPKYKQVIKQFNLSGLKPSQRIRAMEIASRIFQLDDTGLEQFFSRYGMVCESIQDETAPLITGAAAGHVREFIDQRCELHASNSVSKADLFSAYCGFTSGMGKHPLSREVFFKSLYALVPVQTVRVRFGDSVGRKRIVCGVGIKN